MNNGADIALDSAPVTLVLYSDWNENSGLYVQKAVLVTEDELDGINGDVVPKIMPTNSERVEQFTNLTCVHNVSLFLE